MIRMISCLLVGLSSAQLVMAKIQSETHEFKAKDIKTCMIHNATGDVHVAPVATDKAHIVVNKVKWGPRCSALVENKNGELRVEMDDKAWILDHECRVDLVVSIPNGIPLSVRAGTGNVQVLATRGNVDVKVGSGLISLKGEIQTLNALSGSGDIRLEGSARSASIKTGSGDIELDYKEAPEKGKLSVRTGSGDVQLYLPAVAEVQSQISTGNGLVINEFTPAQKNERFAVDASSETGNIQIRKK